MMGDPVDGRDFRRVLGHYPTGVCVITSSTQSGPLGMVVGSFTSVSLDPPLIAFLPDRKSTKWPRIEAAGHFCVNILAENQQDICGTLSTKGNHRFDSISYRLSDSGLPIIAGVVAWIDCRLHAVHEAGDHFIALGLVRAMDVECDSSPLVFVRGGYGALASTGVKNSSLAQTRSSLRRSDRSTASPQVGLISLQSEPCASARS